VTRSCPLCERAAAAYEVYGAHLDATTQDDRLDYVELKRDLEDVLECRLTVARVKRHFHDHIVYVFEPSEPVAEDDSVDGRDRGSRDDRRSRRRWRP